MQPTSRAFRANAAHALRDASVQQAMGILKRGFVDKRQAAAGRLPEFETLRDEARDIKDHTLDHLDLYLERFEAKVTERGGQVHWAQDAAEARRIVLGICRRANAKTVTKSKSMITEEVGLNGFLEANGIEPIETDLGEYIIQLRGEAPSHIIAPAIHVSKEQVADAFLEHHARLGYTTRLTDRKALVNEARQVLRAKFLGADVGITGANFLVAETGTSVLVTNEGNADLTNTVPRVHVVVASLEKVVPTLEDAQVLLRVLARSGTGQEYSSYTTFSSGPKRTEDLDGPDEYHVVLLDNGRSSVLGTEFQEMLRCIRCGACMNHCPVYGAIGGHAYGWVYPGPIGAVLDPALIGIGEAAHLPNASTFCGRCESVCPVRIPLPKLMRHWREREFERHLSPATVRAGLGVWARLAARPRAYRLATRLGSAVLRLMGRRRGRIAALPLAGGWTKYRDLPAPAGDTFMAQYARGRRS